MRKENKEEEKEVDRAVTPKSFVHRTKPANERARREEKRPEDGETKANSSVRTHTKRSERRDQVHHQITCAKDPEVVHDGDDALEALADLNIDVLIKAGSHGAKGGQRRPVFLSVCSGSKPV